MIRNDDRYTLKDQDFQLKVTKFGHAESIKRHYHDFIEFVYVYSGFSMHKIYGTTSLLLPGDMFFIPPGVSHEYLKTVNNSVYNCLFYPEVLGEDLKELVKLSVLDRILSHNPDTRWNRIHLAPGESHEILELLMKLEYETERKPMGWALRAKALLTAFLVSISRVWSLRKDVSITDGLDSTSTKYNADVKVDNNAVSKTNNNNTNGNAQIIMKILESFGDTMTVEEMAKAAGCSADHFSRVFKKFTGLSPSAYITSLKISAAAEKLLDSSLSISRAAELSGFDDINYFSRLFKKETGYTPSQFRKI